MPCKYHDQINVSMKKCAFKEHTLTRDQIYLVYKNNFPLKTPKIYLSSCLHNYSLSCRRFVSFAQTYFVLLHFHEVCKYAKWFKTMCSCRVSDLTHVFISANQMKDFSSFLFCFPYSTLLNALVHYIAHIPTADAAPETNLCLLPMS